MPDAFDPYFKWLGIHPKDQPPTHYRLLGIELFESDLDVIQSAAERVMLHLQTLKISVHSDLSQRLLNEIAQARICLLEPKRKTAYDQQLRERAAQAIPRAPPMAVAISPVAPASAEMPLETLLPAGESTHLRRARQRRARGFRAAHVLGIWLLAGLGAAGYLLWTRYDESARLSEPSPSEQGKTDDGPRDSAEFASGAKPGTGIGSSTAPVDPPATSAVRPPTPVPPAPPFKKPSGKGTGRPKVIEPVVETPAARKLPVPGSEAVAVAEQRLEAAGGRADVAADILAARSAADPSDQYVLADRARKAAIAAGNVAQASAATDLLVERFEVDGLELSTQTLLAMRTTVSGSGGFRELSEAAMKAAETCGSARAGSAGSLSELALFAARKANDYDLTRRATLLVLKWKP